MYLVDMPRPLRTLYPGVPVHVVQRGHNRNPCFFAEEDYACYLALMREVMERTGIALHAYVLMTNHVHLLMTPRTEDGFAHAMISVGSRYVRYVNRKYGRVGTLWDGRFRSSLVQTEGYLFACQRYIELNPVRAGMVINPADYRWSSYRCHAFGLHDGLVTLNVSYLALGDTPVERGAYYRQTCEGSVDEGLLERIRSASDHGQPLGDETFVESIAAATGVSSVVRKPGRPRQPPA